ncbi:hypothetical protein WOLCODRAFT_139307 [Wolfiporia cocos MD-104 SS10]|uniref:SWR1-complex protein 5 n=1 Tax=Wolfiporia cocos (strain MD-104) TaxID=742152 RepID=A0A2H3K8W3_WOLCO|nr:hypothetical protein WOLCODRAFT_139307 [Wolfiporia cocos MD-104 SS10]
MRVRPCREVKEVPEDSEEARKWPRWRPPTDSPEMSGTNNPTPDSAVAPETTQPQADARPDSAKAPSASTSKPHVKRPGPRKPKTTLAPLPGAQKAKKLTTLDKSAMDWRSHVQADEQVGLKDELEANRRGGGYLEKVEFLKRVEDRKADALDATRSKRRKG